MLFCAGADSARLLAIVLEKVRGAELVIGNLDANLIAEQPRLGPHKAALRASLARLLGLDPAHVSIKIRSNEGLDAIGQGRAIAAQAVVMLHPASAEPQGPPTAGAP